MTDQTPHQTPEPDDTISIPRVDLSAPLPPPVDGPLSSLNPVQRARVAALSLSGPLLTSKGLTGSHTPDVFDLMRLAQWILDGRDMIDMLGVKEEAANQHLDRRIGTLPTQEIPTFGDGNTEDRA